jgi:hypothetical protein
MIKAVHISRFRGIRECVAEGLGRVNLLIGKNDCGKTAFMEAVQLADDVEHSTHRLLSAQRRRLRRVLKVQDFGRFWRPVFFELEAKVGLSISLIDEHGARQTVDMRQGEARDEIISSRPDSVGVRIGADGAYDGQDLVKSPAWAIDVEITKFNQSTFNQRIIATPDHLKLPPFQSEYGSAWISSGANVTEDDIRIISSLKQRGQDRVLLELLREIDDRVTGIELLAPGGDVAELFVRIGDGALMLPAALMGEGFQRCLEIGASAVEHHWPTLFIDEIENGMHHLALEPLWRWIATIARRRSLQVFATTHSEECIHAASRAFQALDDDGLRVIRLDRMESRTRAALYDRALVETAERTGTEIRG